MIEIVLKEIEIIFWNKFPSIYISAKKKIINIDKNNINKNTLT